MRLMSENVECSYKTISVLAATRTIVAIAHRLSTIENADMILVLEECRFVQSVKKFP